MSSPYGKTALDPITVHVVLDIVIEAIRDAQLQTLEPRDEIRRAQVDLFCKTMDALGRAFTQLRKDLTEC